MQVDFGIASQDHLGAFQYAWKGGRTPESSTRPLGAWREKLDAFALTINPTP